VGFSQHGVHFKYQGHDQYILWQDIISITIENQFTRSSELRLMNGEVLLLGFIDKSILQEMNNRKEEYTQIHLSESREN
jgi:hypothetical protein